MKRAILCLLLAVAGCQWAAAQRYTDVLDRGLVALPTGSTSGSTSNFVSWRRLADEYYDVTYNLYKNGTLLASGLTTTSYDDWNRGLPTTTYAVAAVVGGVEQERCAAVTPWTQYVYKSGNERYPTGFLDIALAAVYDRNGNDVTTHYEPNDAEMADLDGDGQLEIIIKRLNTYDAWNGSELYPVNSNEFVVLDAYDVNWQTGAATLMWRIDCGPNMVSLNSTEIDIIAYDWDEDGQAEVVLRGADNMIVYASDGRTQLWTVGNMSVNTRDKMKSHSDQQYAWTHTGAEYLIYMNGRTAAPYQVTDFPLPRFENGESSEKNAWGDDYGHRSSKYFFGAPFLDGRKASLFLARGIYTRHKMIAMDLNHASHTWSERWRWNNNSSNSPWYGQGNHNYVVADVDEDGRDEIVYGSMVIDDNGRGLSTTGLGHGDAIHVGDLDPYRRGLEVFACNEEKPSCNYRNATTSELYFRQTSSSDDGRALMANFTNSYPGSVGRSVQTGMISSVANKVIGELGELIGWGDLNFRIYWDGDLCSEVLNSPGTAKDAKIDKPGWGRIFASTGCNMNNDSKNNPCFQGDIIGDWREEIVLRCGANLRVYTTGIGTAFTMPSLWFDHQYRQAMVWQMMAYNQPPHTSFFLGEMEGITLAPPPLTNSGRTEITPGATIGTSLNGKHALICDNTSTATTYTLADGARPAVITVNTPIWVQGNNDNNNITVKDDYVHTLKGTLSGTTRLTKQGGGTLRLSATTHTHTGQTDVWGGTLMCNGTLQNSPVWLNRFATLSSTDGTFNRGITADYGAAILPGGENTIGTITTSTLTLNHGARLVVDVRDDFTSDKINVATLTLNTKSGNEWTAYGPRYLAPVLEIVANGPLSDATYDLGSVTQLVGNVSDIIVEGISGASLRHANGHLQLVVGTGTPTTCTDAVISENSLQPTDEGILLPVVDIAATPFTYGNKTVVPTLRATFTDLDGVTTEAEIIRHFYDEDYERATNVSGWISWGATMNIDSDEAHGRHFAVNTGTTNTRFAYYTLADAVDVSTVPSYAVEFDLAVTPANTDPVEFCVMSRGGIMPSNNWDNYAAINGNANMLFDITAPKSSTTYTVNGTATTTDLPAGVWHHYTLLVDRNARNVKWSISNGSTGTFSLPEGTSADVAGFYLVAGRYYSAFRLDNIHIHSTGGFSYVLNRPGTLAVTSSYAGCMPSTTTYDARFVGIEIGTEGLATLGCNYPINLTSSGLTNAYIVQKEYDERIGISEVSAAPPATGLLLKGIAGTYRLPITDVASPLGTNLLHAVTAHEGYAVASTNIYVLDNGASGMGFYKCRVGDVVPPAKAYLQLTSGATRPDFIGIQGFITVGLTDVRQHGHTPSPLFTPAGQRVAKPRHGLYVGRNRKVVQ